MGNIKEKTKNKKEIKELLEKMLKHQSYFAFGLCNWAWEMYCFGKFSKTEYEIVEAYIKHNRPFFASSIDAFKHALSCYYWPPTRITPRIEWLKKHIEKNSK